MQRISDLNLLPSVVQELMRLAKIDKDWVEIKFPEESAMSVAIKYNTSLSKECTHAANSLAMLSLSRWLIDGPKVFKPTLQQCKALEQVEVKLNSEDYSQPFPAILIELDYSPFTSVLCYRNDELVTFTLTATDPAKDILVYFRSKESYVEDALNNFFDVRRELCAIATLALRVACNSCLALSNFEHHLDYILPKEVERDRSLSMRNDESGEKAKQRIKLAVKEIKLDHTVRLHTSRGFSETDGTSGREVSFHWRRGHWAMQPYGQNNSLRKRILRRPCMVRSDLLNVDPSAVITTYKS